MKSAFGSKRKARKIQVDEDDESGAQDVPKEILNTTSSSPSTSGVHRKAFKKSSLRQSITFDEQDGSSGDSGSTNGPTFGRSNSLMKKKKVPSSRLSFGPGEIISGDAAEALENDEAFTPKKPTMGRRVMEGNAIRRSLPYQSLPLRSNEDDEERPTYSKDYLNELKNSTPVTPKDLSVLHAAAEDEEGLDASELEGAMIVDTEEPPAPSHIPTEAEIQEKKERRARLAQEKDFISLSDTSNDNRISLLPQKKKNESRLVREDEDLGEGFDEFVEDGRISLGKKQEREARKKHRKEMAEMIHRAEGSTDEESDDSEAERRAAYEAAQIRAGMDGLHKSDEKAPAASQIPAKITPLPVLSECLDRLQKTLSSMEQELARRQKKLDESKQEKLDIAAREAEVQELLKQAGSRYAALKADTSGAVADPKSFVEGASLANPIVVDRGLESFGNTPTVRTDAEDIG